MVFLYPAFLFSLLAIAIPVIIHLFNFRNYKLVHFSNVKLLKNIQSETKSHSKLKNLLLLFCRILTICAIVFAFAKPYLPINNSKTNFADNIVSIYIDNSFSMNGQVKNGNALEIAKKQARSIAEAYPANTSFILLTNDLEAKHQHLVNKEQLSEYLFDLHISPTTRNISEIVSRQIDFLTNSPKNKKAYLISDFQKNSSDFAEIKNNNNIDFSLIKTSIQASSNLYIDSCWFQNPTHIFSQEEKIFVKIVNNSQESYQNIPVKLLINDTLRAVGSVNIAENSNETCTLAYTNTNHGITHGKIEISDYPITYDNTFYFTYTIPPVIKILIINEKDDNKYLNAIWKDDASFELENSKSTNLEIANISKAHFIIINEVLDISSGLADKIFQFLHEGRNILFVPAANGNFASYNSILQKLNSNIILEKDTSKTKINSIDFNNEIFRNVFKHIDKNNKLPIIFQHIKLSQTVRGKEIPIFTTQKNQTILSQTKYEGGTFYQLNSAIKPEANTLITHPVFISALYNMALFSQFHSKLYYVLGKDNYVDIPINQLYLDYNENNLLRINNLKRNYDYILPQNKNKTNDEISLDFGKLNLLADNYSINEKKPIMGLALNYNRNESALEFLSESELESNLEKYKLSNFKQINVLDSFLTKSIKEKQTGIPLWKYFLLAALLFIALEIVIIKFYPKKSS